jgi:16S rRNA (cytosine1402-N4)-methyltransferase
MVHHHPVLLEEVITYLACRDGKNYIDCTLGGGGHASQILEKSSPTGRLLGIDWDREAIRIARGRLKRYGRRAILVLDSFSNLSTIVREHAFGPVDGILLDLGVSSFQLEDAQRGFSFRFEGPLDMRMDSSRRETASDLINGLPARELERLLRTYGESRWAKRISRVIEKRRQKSFIATTTELRDIVHSAIPASFRSKRIDAATKTFMALRIAVNKELDNLKEVLKEAVSVLERGGRICIISFHSLEDRLVKEFFRMAEKGCTCPPRLPQCVCHGEKTLHIVEPKPISPSWNEIIENPRARSAKLRIAERV